MPRLAWENPDDFLRLDEFATPCELYRNGVLMNEFPVIYDEPSTDAQVGVGDRRFDATSPTIMTIECHLRGAQRGDEVRVDGRRFDVLGLPEAQGDGWARLRLAPMFGQGGR